MSLNLQSLFISSANGAALWVPVPASSTKEGAEFAYFVLRLTQGIAIMLNAILTAALDHMV